MARSTWNRLPERQPKVPLAGNRTGYRTGDKTAVFDPAQSVSTVDAPQVIT
jgi:hypothetical protein